MDIILGTDTGSERSPYQSRVLAGLVDTWPRLGQRHVVATAEALAVAGPSADSLAGASALLRTYPAARVHLLTSGPAARALAEACRRQDRPYTSSSDCVEPESQADFELACRSVHAAAQQVMVPSHAAAQLLAAQGIHHTRVLLAGVDAEVFQPRVYDYLDLPRPLALFLGGAAQGAGLRQFMEAPLPGSRLVYAPAWTGGPKQSDAQIFSYLPPAELAELISAADVCVICEPDAQALGLCLQSLACGVPVASTPNPFLADLLEPNDVGATDAELGQAVERALGANRQLCRRVGLAGAWPAVARQILAAGAGSAACIAA